MWAALSVKSVDLGPQLCVCLSISQVTHARLVQSLCCKFYPQGKTCYQSCCHWFTGSLGTRSLQATGASHRRSWLNATASTRWEPLRTQAWAVPTQPLLLHRAESRGRAAKLASRVTPDLESLSLLAHNSRKASFWHFNYFLVLLTLHTGSFTDSCCIGVNRTSFMSKEDHFAESLYVNLFNVLLAAQYIFSGDKYGILLKMQGKNSNTCEHSGWLVGRWRAARTSCCSWCIQELGAHFPHTRLRSLLREGRQVKEKTRTCAQPLTISCRDRTFLVFSHLLNSLACFLTLSGYNLKIWYFTKDINSTHSSVQGCTLRLLRNS